MLKHRTTMTQRRPRGRNLLAAAACAAILLGMLAAAPAPAQVPPLLWQSPADGMGSSMAGPLGPNGIGVEPSTPGHLFVAAEGSSRIVELDAWGQFERAWGWEAVASGPGDDAPQNERQQLTVSATTGTYKLRYFNVYQKPSGIVALNTNEIPFNATAGAVQAALEALPSFDPGDVTVSGGPGDAGGTSPYLIEFSGNYADTAIPELTVIESTLSGGSGATVETLQEGGSFEVCVPAEGDTCQSGQGGGHGAGQFAALRGLIGGVTVDSNGDVYVFEVATNELGEEISLRVQKFDNDGNFLLMWGGEVNKTTGADRCTKADLEAGDVCGAGVPGAGPGELEGPDGNRIALGPEGNVFVGSKERIQEFDQTGNYLGEVALAGETVRGMAIDAAGNFYVTYFGKDDVRKLSPGGVEASLKFKAEDPRSVAVGRGGKVYVVEKPFGLSPRILGFDADGSCFICTEDNYLAMPNTSLFGLATSTACGIAGEDIYVSILTGSFGAPSKSFLRAYGPQPDPTIEGCKPPEAPPSIEDQYAASVATDSAVLRAAINPHFWSGPVLGPTTYYLQHATAACIEAGGWEAECVEEQPAPPGEVLKAEAIDAAIPTAPIALGGLSPDTAYRYRFVAQSPGGGPVFGEGGTEETDGAEGSFRTFKLPPGPQGNCANDAFRNGPAALLPDCRAYEMVSPAEKGNGDIVTLIDAEKDLRALNQSSITGDALTYSSFRAFGDADSAALTVQYLAHRGASGWRSEAISPPRGVNFLSLIESLHNEFKAFSPDLCEAWVFHGSPMLASGAAEGFGNLYKRDNCGPGAGAYEALSTVAPPNREAVNYFPELQGVSADGEHAIFRAPDKLTPDAPDLGPGEGYGIDQLYEAHGEGQLRFVCLRPNGTPAPNGCVAGTASDALRNYGRQQAVTNAISDDGSRIFWSEQTTELSKTAPPGKLYVRIEGKKTLALSSVPAQYWTAAADGSAAIFTTGDLGKGEAVLHRYDVDAKADGKVAEGVFGVMGASQDADRIYFASSKALDEGASAGEPNLYLWQKGAYHFIATLAVADAQAETSGEVSTLNVEPSRHMAQVTDDGLAAAFMSTASLTGQDNTDLSSSEADAEVFHYDATTDQLRCASCNPTGARPRGRKHPWGTWAAAQIPGAQTQIHLGPRALSTDGGRLFFESYQPLVANDINGKADVYQWEQPGKGTCTTPDPTYSPLAGGCVTLISSGLSASDSRIADASPSGDDVFFATASPLLPGSDPDGLIDIYDARVLGGYPSQPLPPAPCEGDGCQGPTSPPNDPTPASASFEGAGNVKEAPKASCRKPRVRRKGRCVAKRQKQRKRAGEHRRRTAR